MRNRPGISPFLLVFFGGLFIGCMAVFAALVLAFQVTRTSNLIKLVVALILLCASFVASMVIGYRYYNIYTRMFYLISCVWIGFFTYAFMVSILYSVLGLIWPGFIPFGKYLFFAALVTTIYALVHAQHIVVEKITVTLPNLPENWRGKKAAWISDIHLGQLYGAPFSQKISDLIMSFSPDLIFVGGDLYDGTGAPDILKLSTPLSSLKAPQGVYFITGNHEEYGDIQKFLTTVESVGMRILHDEKVELDGLQLIGVHYKTSADTSDFEKILAGLSIDKNRPTILLKHEPKDLHIASQAGVSLQISGHTHNAQLWPLNYVANMIHKGFAYGLRSFEKLQIYTSSGVGTWGPPMRVGTNSEIALFTFE